jgi:phytoene desaturase
MKKTCAVIGSGIAGLAAAIRVAAKGYEVVVFEANNYLGGKIKQQFANGYRFDMGPSVVMLPHLIDELFVLHNKNPRDYFTYSAIETSFKYFFEDGTVINAYSDVEQFGKEIDQKTIDSKQSFDKYRSDIEVKYKITREVFIENSLHVFKNYLSWKMVSGFLNFHKIDSFKTMNEGNRRFFKDPHLLQIFNNYATYIGSNPYVAPATLNVIQHLEINLGAYMPDKGIYSMVEALVKLAEEVGVIFKLSTRVVEILTANNKIVGIATESDANLPFDRVVSNMDIYFTYKKLLPGAKLPLRIINQPKSSSIMAFYWGVNKVHPELGIHTMLFSEKEKEEYDAVFDLKTIYKDPTLYIFITSKHVKGDAPPGCENWFVLTTAPNDSGQDWEDLTKETRKNAVDKINRILKTNIEQHIEYEDVLTPTMIRDSYSSAFGAVYGNSSNSKFAAFFRHANFSKTISGLYFVGGSVHPGPGLPMCLNSAKIMDKVFK